MDLIKWIVSRDGIAHRKQALAAGWKDADLRAAVALGSIRIIRRTWLTVASAPPDLVAAANAGARLTCVSLARERGWWMPELADSRRHLSIPPHARAGTIEQGDVVHWTMSVAPVSAWSLRVSVEDALAHIARCETPENARILWESAIQKERLSPLALQEVHWKSRAAAELSLRVTGLADSGLESIFVVRLSPWGLPIRQQVPLAGRPVDILIGAFLVVQVDGFAYHSTAADRDRDVSHDQELRLRGYTVLRFTYSQVHHDWPAVERAIVRAIAAGLHLHRH